MSDLHVEKLIPGGQGYARASDGRVVLLTQVVPGDVVTPLVVREHKSYLEVLEWRLVTASQDRVPPTCGVAERCGGCDWMALSDSAQRHHKLALVREALARTGKIFELPNTPELIEGERRLEYRSRIRLQVSAAGEVGFCSAASHTLVEAPTCKVSEPRLNHALNRLRDLGKEYSSSLETFAYVELRTTPDESVSVYLVPKETGNRVAHNTRELLDRLRQEFTVVVERNDRSLAKGLAATIRTPSDPETWQRYPLLDETYLLAPPGAFTQVNWDVNQKLVAAVVAGAKARGIRSFADLYCGSGNFTLPLLAEGYSGVGVESNALSIAAARQAARRQSLDSAAFIADDAEHIAKTWAKQGKVYDLVLIDPPRAGVKSGLEPMARLATRYLVICSCNPVTLARDLKALLTMGFELEHLSAFDMFPQTHHVEVLAWLRKT